MPACLFGLAETVLKIGIKLRSIVEPHAHELIYVEAVVLHASTDNAAHLTRPPTVRQTPGVHEFVQVEEIHTHE